MSESDHVSLLQSTNVNSSKLGGKTTLSPLTALSPVSSNELLDKTPGKGSGSKHGRSSTEKKKARKLKMERLRQTKHATLIQAAWRGSRARRGKENSSNEKTKAIRHFLGSYEKSMKNLNSELKQEAPETVDDKVMNNEPEEEFSGNKNVQASHKSTVICDKSPTVCHDNDVENRRNEKSDDGAVVVTNVENHGGDDVVNETAEIVNSLVGDEKNDECEQTIEEQPDNSVTNNLDAKGDEKLAGRQPKSTTADSGNIEQPPDIDDGAEVRFSWPSNFHDEFASIGDSGLTWPDINIEEATDMSSVLRWVMDNQKVLTRTVTWNMQANDPPPVADVQKKLVPLNK